MEIGRRGILTGASAVAAGAGALLGARIAHAEAPAGGSAWQQIQQTKKLRVGAALSEPWYYKDTENSSAAGGVKVGDTLWRGFGPNLGKLIADAMGVELAMVETTWGTAVAGLQANQFDTMFILDPTPVRALSVDFSPSPVLWYPVAGLAKNDINVKQWDELNNPKYRICVSLGSSTDQFASRVLPKATITRYANTGDQIAAFQSNRVDIALTTAQTSDLARAKLHTGKTIVLKPVAAVPAGAAVRAEPDHRWYDYLTTVVAYYYNVGTTQKVWEDYLAFRGLNPKEATPIAREYW